MSWQPASPPAGDRNPEPADLATIIVPRARDIGGFEVRRALPSAKRQMIGPFIFWDQMGPAVLAPGTGIDVRPHPHIGLATVTYLFDGEILHRDNLGSVQAIRPGAVNWMIAGRGIAHSERTPPELRPAGPPLFGIQSWIALPKALEECAPGFWHHAADALPKLDGEGKIVRLIAGTLFGARSPVETPMPMVYADIALEAGARLAVPTEHEERGLYLVSGSVSLGAESFAAGQLLVLQPGQEITVRASGGPARLMLLGGAPMDGPRHIWWNFVSSSRDRIEQAKEDWRQGRFPPVPGEHEFIPLPE